MQCIVWVLGLFIFSSSGCRRLVTNSALTSENNSAYRAAIQHADSLVRSGNPGQALTLYEEAHLTADSLGHVYNRGELLGILGRLYLIELGDIPKAEKVLLQQEDWILKHPDLPDALRTRNYLDLSGVYRRRYDLAHAESYAMMAFYTLRQGRLEDSVLHSRTYAVIGALRHQKKEADSAYYFLHRSRHFYPSDVQPAMANLDWLIAWINRCNNEDLRQPIRQAVGRYWLDYYLRLGDQDPFIRTDAYRLKSIFFWQIQAHDSCIYYANLAIQGYHAQGDGQPYPRAFTYALKSGSLLAQGLFAAAHVALDSALLIRFGATDDMEAFKKDIYSIDILSSKAEAFLDEGIHMHDHAKVLEALTLYDSIKVLIHHFTKWDTDGHIYNKVYTNFFYTYQVKACAYLFRATGSQEWLVRLHDVLASYKGELFVRERRMQDLRSKGKEGHKLFITFLENDSRLEQALYEASIKPFEDRVSDFPQIHQLYKEKRRLAEVLERDASTLLHAIREDRHITANELLRYCSEKNTAVIQYYIGDRFYNPDSIYGLVAGQGRLDLVTCRYDSLLESAIRAMDQVHRLTVVDQEDVPDSRYLKNSFYVFEQVLGPMIHHLRNERSLVLIPDGDLHHVAFEGLLMTYPQRIEGIAWNDPSIRYVLDSFSIRYAFSPDRLLPEPEEDGPFPFEMVGMAYTDMKTLVNTDPLWLPELLGSYREIEVLREQFGENSTRFITGYELTRDHFFKYAPKARVLHLSTHGQFLPGVRRSGMLYVRRGKTLDEIYQFELRFAEIRPELLVLSACESGAGEVVMEEGMMSIGRVFQATGSGQVISARWPVSDRASTDFFRVFYTSYRQSRNANEAFRTAQLSLRLGNGQFAFPGHWAGYGIFM